MQIRKLVKSGTASLVIAVPKDWITRNKLKAGDLLYISDDSNKLTITSELKKQPPEKKEVVIHIDDKNLKIVAKDIASAYLNDAYYIVITGKDLCKRLKEIKKFVTDMIALEIVEESATRLLARSFLNIYDVDVKLVARRMDNIVRSMMTDTKDLAKNPAMPCSVVERDVEVNRLCFLNYKILKAAYLRPEVLDALQLQQLDILRYWELNMHIEKIADRTKNISTIVPQLDKKQRETFVELFHPVEDLYKEVMKAFYNSSIPEADLAALKRDSVLTAIHKYVSANNSAKSAQIAINLYNMVSNINDINRVIRDLN
jgi:phosphate uptake regulator